jgi:hypothetical protein
MKTLTNIFEQTDQQFSNIFSKLKPNAKLEDPKGNIFQIESIEDRKRLQIAKLKDIKTGDIIPVSFSEIANLIINKDWKFI